MQKRILFTVTNDLETDQRMQRICTTLSTEGYLVSLIGRKLPSSKPLSARNFRQVRLWCFFTKGALFYLEYNIRLFFYLLIINADAYCAVDLDTILPCLFASKFRGVKFGYDAHEYFCEVPELVHRKRIKSIWKAIERFTVPRTDFRYTVSHTIAELFENEYHKPFVTIRNLPILPFEDIEVSTPELPLFILYQGALNDGRGLEALINIAEKIPLFIKIAGTGYLETKLKKMAMESPASQKIEFLGNLKPEELKKITPKAFLGYNLLENLGLSYYYSLSNKFFDYSMATVPSLNPPFPEYERLINEYGIGVTSSCFENEIESTILRLLEDKDLYQKMKFNCLKASEELNWNQESKKIIQLYSEVF